MNTRITCLLLFVIAHASAIAAPKFPVRLNAGIGDNSAAEIGVLAWSPDGNPLASNGLGAEDAGQLLLWDAVNWGRKPKERISANDMGSVIEIDFFDPKDSTRLALFFMDSAQKRYNYGILNLKRPKDKPRIIGQKLKLSNLRALRSSNLPVIKSANWSRDGRKVAFNSTDGISIVDPVSGKILHTLNARNAREVLIPARKDFGQVAGWSPDGKYLVTKTRGGRGMVVFDEKLEEELFRYDVQLPDFRGFIFGSGIMSVAWNPKGTEIAFSVGMQDYRLRKVGNFKGRSHLHFFDMKGREANEDPVGAPSRYKRFNRDFDSDRSFLMKDGKGVKIPFGTQLLAWDPQGRRIATVALSVKPQLWTDIHIYNKKGDLLHEFEIKDLFHHPKKSRGARTNGGVRSLAWSPDGFKLAAGLSDGTIRIFKTPK